MEVAVLELVVFYVHDQRRPVKGKRKALLKHKDT